MTTPGQPKPLRALGWLGLFAVLTYSAAFAYQSAFLWYLNHSEGPQTREESRQRLFEFFTSSLGLGSLYLLQVVVILPGLLWAAHFPQQSWRRTLAINPVRLETVGKWLALWLLTMTIVGYVLYQLDAGRELFMDQFLSEPHWLMLLSASVLAPVLEELLFRGYLFQAFRHTRLGFSGTLLVTSVLFALMHGLQYSWYGVAQIFCLALLLGFARERTGSVLTPLAIHVTQNSLASLVVMSQ